MRFFLRCFGAEKGPGSHVLQIRQNRVDNENCTQHTSAGEGPPDTEEVSPQCGASQTPNQPYADGCQRTSAGPALPYLIPSNATRSITLALQGGVGRSTTPNSGVNHAEQWLALLALRTTVSTDRSTPNGRLTRFPTPTSLAPSVDGASLRPHARVAGNVGSLQEPLMQTRPPMVKPTSCSSQRAGFGAGAEADDDALTGTALAACSSPSVRAPLLATAEALRSVACAQPPKAATERTGRPRRHSSASTASGGGGSGRLPPLGRLRPMPIEELAALVTSLAAVRGHWLVSLEAAVVAAAEMLGADSLSVYLLSESGSTHAPLAVAGDAGGAIRLGLPLRAEPPQASPPTALQRLYATKECQLGSVWTAAYRRSPSDGALGRRQNGRADLHAADVAPATGHTTLGGDDRLLGGWANESPAASEPGVVAVGGAAAPSALPPDWQAMRVRGGMTNFVAVPLRRGGAVVGALQVADACTPPPDCAGAVPSSRHFRCAGELAIVGTIIASLLIDHEVLCLLGALEAVAAARNVDGLVRALARHVGLFCRMRNHITPGIRVALIREDAAAMALFLDDGAVAASAAAAAAAATAVGDLGGGAPDFAAGAGRSAGVLSAAQSRRSTLPNAAAWPTSSASLQFCSVSGGGGGGSGARTLDSTAGRRAAHLAAGPSGAEHCAPQDEMVEPRDGKLPAGPSPPQRTSPLHGRGRPSPPLVPPPSGPMDGFSSSRGGLRPRAGGVGVPAEVLAATASGSGVTSGVGGGGCALEAALLESSWADFRPWFASVVSSGTTACAVTAGGDGGASSLATDTLRSLRAAAAAAGAAGDDAGSAPACPPSSEGRARRLSVHLIEPRGRGPASLVAAQSLRSRQAAAAAAAGGGVPPAAAPAVGSPSCGANVPSSLLILPQKASVSGSIVGHTSAAGASRSPTAATTTTHGTGSGLYGRALAAAGDDMGLPPGQVRGHAMLTRGTILAEALAEDTGMYVSDVAIYMQDGRNASRDVFLAHTGRGGPMPPPTNCIAVTAVRHCNVPLVGLYVTYAQPLPPSMLSALILKVHRFGALLGPLLYERLVNGESELAEEWRYLLGDLLDPRAVQCGADESRSSRSSAARYSPRRAQHPQPPPQQQQHPEAPSPPTLPLPPLQKLPQQHSQQRKPQVPPSVQQGQARRRQSPLYGPNPVVPALLPSPSLPVAATSPGAGAAACESDGQVAHAAPAAAAVGAAAVTPLKPAAEVAMSLLSAARSSLAGLAADSRVEVAARGSGTGARPGARAVAAAAPAATASTCSIGPSRAYVPFFRRCYTEGWLEAVAHTDNIGGGGGSPAAEGASVTAVRSGSHCRPPAGEGGNFAAIKFEGGAVADAPTVISSSPPPLAPPLLYDSADAASDDLSVASGGGGAAAASGAQLAVPLCGVGSGAAARTIRPAGEAHDREASPLPRAVASPVAGGCSSSAGRAFVVRQRLHAMSAEVQSSPRGGRASGSSQSTEVELSVQAWQHPLDQHRLFSRGSKGTEGGSHNGCNVPASLEPVLRRRPLQPSPARAANGSGIGTVSPSRERALRAGLSRGRASSWTAATPNAAAAAAGDAAAGSGAVAVASTACGPGARASGCEGGGAGLPPLPEDAAAATAAAGAAGCKPSAALRLPPGAAGAGGGGGVALVDRQWSETLSPFMLGSWAPSLPASSSGSRGGARDASAAAAAAVASPAQAGSGASASPRVAALRRSVLSTSFHILPDPGVQDAGKVAPLMANLQDKLRSLQAEQVLARLQRGRSADGNADGNAESGADELCGLVLLEPLGSGGFGAVYRGIYNGIEVAVKVLCARGSGGRNEAATIREAFELAVMTTISHPHIVQVFSAFTDVIVTTRPGSAGGPPYALVMPRSPATEQLGEPTVAIAMEFCDAGSLADALAAGRFRRKLPGGFGATEPWLQGIYATLLEIALALRHLHAMQLVHCDLKPANVLLKSNMRDPRGFSTKLSDFGLVKMVFEDAAGVIGRDARTGTVTHMAPELICATEDSAIDTSADVFAFGVIMWEMICSCNVYIGMGSGDIRRGVASGALRPEFPSWTETRYRSLAEACLSFSPADRPTSAQLVARLRELLAESGALQDIKERSTMSAFAGAATPGHPHGMPGPPGARHCNGGRAGVGVGVPSSDTAAAAGALLGVRPSAFARASGAQLPRHRPPPFPHQPAAHDETARERCLSPPLPHHHHQPQQHELLPTLCGRSRSYGGGDSSAFPLHIL